MIHQLGWFLPDDDNHFLFHLEKGPIVDGRGSYQWRKIEAALCTAALKKKNMKLALDVGAHVGFWTRPLAVAFERVMAFEPVPKLIECWQANISETNATLIQKAVSDVSGHLYMTPAVQNSGNCHVATSGEPHVSVPAVAIDSLNLESCDLIKIDVEGWELNVVRGAEDTIKKHRPLLVVEQKPNNAERYGVKQLDAVKLLQSWGMSIAWIKSGDYCLTW